MGRQSILELRFGFRKVDLNRNVNLFFMCPDAKVRLFMTRSTRTIQEILDELAKRIKVSADDLRIVHKGREIKPMKENGEKTTPMYYRLHDNDILKVLFASHHPAA